MSPESIHLCPRCRVNLHNGQYENVELDLCPQCNGLLVKQNRLVSLLQAVLNDLDEPLDTDALLEPVPDKGTHNPCPQCGQVMQNFGYMETRYVMIDACYPCSMVWIDADELGPMSWIHARSQLRADQIKKASKQYCDEVARRFSMLRQSQAMAARLAARLM